MEEIRDVYMDMFGVDSLTRRFDIASIVAWFFFLKSVRAMLAIFFATTTSFF
jgi:hypothetical protein